jgi:hypothetical protein
MDLALDPASHDLLLTGGQLRLTSGVPEAAAQRLAVRLSMFLGEWFLDSTAGVPYFQSILTSVPDDAALRTIFRRQIEADPYVVTVTKLVLSLDRVARALRVSFSAQLVNGSELSILIAESLVDGQIVVNTIGVFVDGIPLVL